MSSESVVCLAGTAKQVDGLTPLPAQSGSGRLVAGKLYLPSPFTALHTGRLESEQWSEADLFINWHSIGRPIWQALSPASCWDWVQQLLPSTMTSSTMSQDDALTILTQRVSLDILAPGRKAGTHELQRKIRSIVTNQVNHRLWWLNGTTCRGLDIDTSHLSEPVPAFYCAFALSRRRDGWEQVLLALSRLVQSLGVATYAAGDVGELLTQILCCAAIDHVRFSALPAMSLADGQGVASVVFLDVLSKLVPQDQHQQLLATLTVEGRLSFTRFKPVTETIQSVSQDQLAGLWYSGEAIRACPGQRGWDHLIPVKYAEGFSVWLIQAKNHINGPKWGPRYTTPGAFPRLPGAENLQAVLSYMEISGARSRQDKTTTEIKILTAEGLGTRSGGPGPGRKICIGTWGPVSSSKSSIEEALPIVKQLGFSDAFKRIVYASWIEPGAASEEKREILARAAPGPL